MYIHKRTNIGRFAAHTALFFKLFIDPVGPIIIAYSAYVKYYSTDATTQSKNKEATTLKPTLQIPSNCTLRVLEQQNAHAHRHGGEIPLKRGQQQTANSTPFKVMILHPSNLIFQPNCSEKANTAI